MAHKHRGKLTKGFGWNDDYLGASVITRTLPLQVGYKMTDSAEKGVINIDIGGKAANTLIERAFEVLGVWLKPKIAKADAEAEVIRAKAKAESDLIAAESRIAI